MSREKDRRRRSTSSNVRRRRSRSDSHNKKRRYSRDRKPRDSLRREKEIHIKESRN